MRILLLTALAARLRLRCGLPGRRDAPGARGDQPSDRCHQGRPARQQRRRLRTRAGEPARHAVVHALRRRHGDRPRAGDPDLSGARAHPARAQQAQRAPGAGTAAARPEAGLLAPRTIDYGDMGSIGIADAPTTTLVVNAARPQRQAAGLCARHHGRGRAALARTGQGAPGARALRRAASPGRVRRSLRAPCHRRLRRSVPRPGAARLASRRLAAREQPRNGREARVERPGVPLHPGQRGRQAADGRTPQGERPVALDRAARRQGRLPGGRAPAAPGRAALPLRPASRAGARRTPARPPSASSSPLRRSAAPR